MHILKPLAELLALGAFMACFMGSALILSDTARPSLPLIASMGSR